MTDQETTARVAAALGVPPDDARLEQLHEAMGAALLEWTVDDAGTAGVTAWTGDHKDVWRALEELDSGVCLTLKAAFPEDGVEGVGLIMSRDAPTRVTWRRLAAMTGGERHAAAVADALPELAAAAQVLHDTCGAARCAGLIVETEVEAPRTSVVYRVPDALAAVRILEAMGSLSTRRGSLFFKQVLGIGPDRPRPWPPVLATRTIGGAASWTFTYLARADAARLADVPVLEAIEITQPLAQAWRQLATVPPIGDRMQAMEITFVDGELRAEPGLAIKLGWL